MRDAAPETTDPMTTETIIYALPESSPTTAAQLRRAATTVDAGDGARLIVRGRHVVYRGTTAAHACGNLVATLRAEIAAALATT